MSFDSEDSPREPLIIDADDFIGIKSFKAKGKRLTTFEYSGIKELEPLKTLEEETEPESDETLENEDNNAEDNSAAENVPEEQSDQEIIDEITGQKRLF